MRLRFVAAFLALATLAACATTPEIPPVPPQRTVAEVMKPGEEEPFRVYDPWEGFNRRMYNFNAEFDRKLFIPIVNGYRYVVPEPVRNRVSDFFSNLTEIITFANAVLQGRPKTARRAAIRFAVNTMFTLGFYDLAGFRGIEQQREDFGQTLGVWGVGEGPYLVLPILGPSNLRDAAGLAVDAAPSVFLVPGDVASHPAYKASAYGLRPIDRRHRIAFRYYESGTPFEYDVIRILYREKRRLDILK